MATVAVAKIFGYGCRLWLTVQHCTVQLQTVDGATIMKMEFFVANILYFKKKHQKRAGLADKKNWKIVILIGKNHNLFAVVCRVTMLEYPSSVKFLL